MAPTLHLARSGQISQIRALYFRTMQSLADRMGKTLPEDAYSNLDEVVDARNLYVLKEDNEIVGAFTLRDEATCLYLDTIAIEPGAQNRGLGKLLMKEVVQIAETREMPKLCLHTPEVMDELLAFYGKLGFYETKRALPEHGGDDFLRVHFAKDIANNSQHMDPEHEHDRAFT